MHLFEAFLLIPVSTQNSLPSSRHQAEGNYSHTAPAPHPHPNLPHLPRQQFFENLFPPTAEKGGGKDDLFHQNSVRKYEHDLGH